MAALSRIMKKAPASSSVILPLVNRATPHRSYTSAILTTPLKSRQVCRAATIPTHRHFSALAEKTPFSDNTLVGVTEYKIDDAKEKVDERFLQHYLCSLAKRLDAHGALLKVIQSEIDSNKKVEAPREFPFMIEDNPEENFIRLTREYHGHPIKVRVQTHDKEDESCLLLRDIYSNKSQGAREDEQKKKKHYVDLNVSVGKKGALTHLKFYVIANADEFRINCMDVSRNPISSDDCIGYGEPYTSNLDEDLEKAFITYLELIGIEPSNTKFLCDYMFQRKHKKKYTAWLHDLKNFIAN